jgi:hypothetical protein
MGKDKSGKGKGLAQRIYYSKDFKWSWLCNKYARDQDSLDCDIYNGYKKLGRYFGKRA